MASQLDCDVSELMRIVVEDKDGGEIIYNDDIIVTGGFYVDFVTNGGTSVQRQLIADGGTATEPETTKGGYEFIAWSMDANTNMPYDFGTPVTADLTLYAMWEKLADTSGTPGTTDNDSNSKPNRPHWPSGWFNNRPNSGQNQISVEIPLDSDDDHNNNKHGNQNDQSAQNDGNSSNASGNDDDNDAWQNGNRGNTRLPDTGDMSKIGAALFAGGLSLLALVALYVFKRRKKKSNNPGK